MKAQLGTVRGDFGLGVDKNLCHGSDSLEASAKEIKLWFREGAYEADKTAPALERTFIMVQEPAFWSRLCRSLLTSCSLFPVYHQSNHGAARMAGAMQNYNVIS
jgi:hypothetical protein